MDAVCLSLLSCPLVPWLPLPRIRALPRSPGGRSCRGVLEPPSPRSLFTHVCLVSCAAGQSALLVLFVIMLALTPASSTPAPFPRALFATLCEQPSSSPRATSSRSPCTGSSCSSSSPWVLLPLSARGLARDQSSRRSATPPLQGSKHCLPLSPRQRLAPPCS